MLLKLLNQKSIVQLNLQIACYIKKYYMITVIAGTNRPNSKTEIIANFYYNLLKEKTDKEVKYFSLQSIPLDTLNVNMYSKDGQSPEIAKIQDQFLINAEKWMIVSPEYNGTFPGVLKLFIDAVSVRKYKETFKNKKLGLIGVADGRGGNLRGIDQLTNAMQYLGFSVFNEKLPLSVIKESTDANSITNKLLEEVLDMHASKFLNF